MANGGFKSLVDLYQRVWSDSQETNIRNSDTKRPWIHQLP